MMRSTSILSRVLNSSSSRCSSVSSTYKQSPALMSLRAMSSSNKDSSSSFVPKELQESFNVLFTGFQHNSFHTLFHQTTNFMFIAVPVGFLLSPSSMIQTPLDVTLGFIIPLHSHIGFSAIAADYIPRFAPSEMIAPLLTAARVAILLSTGVLMYGLQSLNVSGPGITPTVQRLWHVPGSGDNHH